MSGEDGEGLPQKRTKAKIQYRDEARQLCAKPMNMTELLLSLLIGIFGGVISSVLTLIGDRWLRRATVERRLRRIAGDYTIISKPGQRLNTDNERISICHDSGRRFTITSTGGPTGDWTGFFIVSADFLDVAHGIYRYPGTPDWGQHELLFDMSSSRIFVYGANRSRPGLIEPFSLTLARVSCKPVSEKPTSEKPPSKEPKGSLQEQLGQAHGNGTTKLSETLHPPEVRSKRAEKQKNREE